MALVLRGQKAQVWKLPEQIAQAGAQQDAALHFQPLVCSCFLTQFLQELYCQKACQAVCLFFVSLAYSINSCARMRYCVEPRAADLYFVMGIPAIGLSLNLVSISITELKTPSPKVDLNWS